MSSVFIEAGTECEGCKETIDAQTDEPTVGWCIDCGTDHAYHGDCTPIQLIVAMLGG